MSGTIKESPHEADWNVLTSRWLEVMTVDGEPQVYSPLEALNQASTIRCIALASPLDLFSAFRFLSTLLYWKADKAGGVKQLRASLLRGEVPADVLKAIEAAADSFDLFHAKKPFLQDTSVRGEIDKKSKRKSAGYLFAEFATGSNVAHFHHGDDEKMRLCLRCATIGMLRVVPWTQYGGQGLTSSVHGAPPIVAIACSENLAVTLGLNLVPIAAPTGVARWTGHFAPTDGTAAIPFLEAFTWSPRRICLGSPQEGSACWGCGRSEVATVGPIIYKKNEDTKQQSDQKLFEWNDPAAFYAADTPYKTMKSHGESLATDGRDLRSLAGGDTASRATVVIENPDHQGWHLVIPCTNPANNKTFDHRQLELTSLSPDALRATLPADTPVGGPKGCDGWTEPGRGPSAGGASRFVRAAARLLTDGDWAALSAAAYREMDFSVAAFDVLSGLSWGLRDKKIAGLPSRNVAWLVLKLMAAVPGRARVPCAKAPFCPLRLLPKRQIDACHGDRSARFRYPASFPRRHRLEADLRAALDKNMRQRTPERIDWAGLCHGLDQLLD